MLPDHATNIDPADAGGAALVGGFLLVIGVLYARNPAGAVDAATAGFGAAAYFVVLPALGVAAGIYAYVGGPYSGIPLFCLGSYLGVFGIGLVFGTLVAESTSTPLLVGGIAAGILAIVAIVVALLQGFGAVSGELLGPFPE